MGWHYLTCCMESSRENSKHITMQRIYRYVAKVKMSKFSWTIKTGIVNKYIMVPSFHNSFLGKHCIFVDFGASLNGMNHPAMVSDAKKEFEDIVCKISEVFMLKCTFGGSWCEQES